jgi:hypothetical protein
MTVSLTSTVAPSIPGMLSSDEILGATLRTKQNISFTFTWDKLQFCSSRVVSYAAILETATPSLAHGGRQQLRFSPDVHPVKAVYRKTLYKMI